MSAPHESEVNTASLMEESYNFSAFDGICGPVLFVLKFFGFGLNHKCMYYRTAILLILHLGLVLGIAVFGIACSDTASTLGIGRFLIFYGTWHVIDSICAIATVIYFFVKRAKFIAVRKMLAKVNIALDPEVIKINRRNAVRASFVFGALSLAKIIPFITSQILENPLEGLKEPEERDALPLYRYFLSLAVLWTIENVINTFFAYPVLALYSVLYVSLCLVCSTYVQSYNNAIRQLKTPSVEEWYVLQQQRIDITSVISRMDDLLCSVYFLWISLFTANIPIALYEWGKYGCSATDYVNSFSDIGESAIHLVVLLLFSSKLHQESMNCVATVSRMSIKKDIEQSFFLAFALQSDPPQMTAWNFFVVTRGTVLTLISIIATYSIVVYQMADFEERQEHCSYAVNSTM